MSKEKKDRLVSFSIIGMNLVALIIFAMSIFGEHNTSLLAFGLGLVGFSNIINAIRINKNKKENQ